MYCNLSGKVLRRVMSSRLSVWASGFRSLVMPEKRSACQLRCARQQTDLQARVNTQSLRMPMQKGSCFMVQGLGGPYKNVPHWVNTQIDHADAQM